MNICELDIKTLSTLAQAELNDIELEPLDLFTLYALEEQLGHLGYTDLLSPVRDAIKERIVHKAAKIAASQIVLAALHHNVIIGASGVYSQRSRTWEFKLDYPFWTREMELLRFAFYDSDDEHFDDIEFADTPTMMFYEVLDELLYEPDMVAKLEVDGRVTPEFLFWACRKILGVLEAFDGNLLADVSLRLIQRRLISALDVAKLVEEYSVVDAD